MLKTFKQYIDKLWTSILAISVALVVTGLIALAAPEWTISAIIVMTAALLIFFGVISLVNILTNTKRKESIVAPVLSSIILLTIGFVLMFTPGFTLDLIFTIIGVIVILRGLIDVAVGLVVQDKDTYKITWTLSGLFGLIAGALIVIKPDMTSVVLTMILGAYCVATGAMGIYYAMRVRKGIDKISKELGE